jgi:hypothetical protein
MQHNRARKLHTSEQRLQRQKYCLYAVNSGPLVLNCVSVAENGVDGRTHLENIETNGTRVDVDIRMETGRVKFNGGSNVGVVCRERYGNSEREAGIDLEPAWAWARSTTGMPLTVSAGPSIVPTHSKRLPSLLGNADYHE